jgi:hypothetical protein
VKIHSTLPQSPSSAVAWLRPEFKPGCLRWTQGGTAVGIFDHFRVPLSPIHSTDCSALIGMKPRIRDRCAGRKRQCLGVTGYSLVGYYGRFEGKCCLHFQSKTVILLVPWLSSGL